MKENEFTVQKEVPGDAIDTLGHVNNVVYLEWVQEVSQMHWENRVDEALRKQMRWVVLTHYMEYKSPCFQGDVLELKTWVKAMKGVKSIRCVEIHRIKDDRLIVKTETEWCLVDAVTLRPKRISPELERIFVIE